MPAADEPTRAEAGLPILKWVGGKTRLLPVITAHYTGQRTVVEPFFGGGALSFHLANRAEPPRVVANDALAPLMEIYAAVRSDVEAFIAQVQEHAKPYLAAAGLPARRAWYYQLRERYMKQEVDGPATLFFLLWCAYSGMYRTGKTYPGRFNTPHGFGREKAGFYHPDRLRWAATAMADWQLGSGDFMDVLRDVDADSFVLLDPPYRETYEGYTGDGFDAEDHLRVVEFFRTAAGRGAKVVYTNKELGDGFYERHFDGFRIERVPIRYQVNRNCADVGRPVSYEVVISS